MWMVGYNEGGGGEHHHHHHLNMVADHHPLFNGRKNNNNNNNNKFRPLIPRPMTSSPNNNYSPTTTTPTPCLSRNNIQGNDFFSHHHQHHHHNLVVGEEKKSSGRSGGGEVVSSSSRWNPTADQVRALEELYRRGIRTPSAEEIQRITGELRRMGKIEGKNVFYWFQNHKARDRQKRRRQMMHHLQSPSSNPLNTHFDALHHKKDSAANRRRVHQVEQTKNCPLPTNSTTLPEESVSIERAAKADGWVQFDGSELEQEQEEEEEQSRNFMDRNGTWRMLLQCPVTNLINTTTTTSLMDPNNLIHTRDHHLSFFASTHHTQQHHQQHNNNINNNNHFVAPQPAAAPTLQLFPLRSGDVDHHKQTHISESDINANNFTPTQFFEFLPLNNN